MRLLGLLQAATLAIDNTNTRSDNKVHQKREEFKTKSNLDDLVRPEWLSGDSASACCCQLRIDDVQMN
jgi:hypothetical protein